MRVVRTATVVLALVAALLPMLPLLQHPCCFSPEDHVLLVIAHPDDETMFFAPTLLWLQSSNVPVSVLCLSTGMVVIWVCGYAVQTSPPNPDKLCFHLRVLFTFNGFTSTKAGYTVPAGNAYGQGTSRVKELIEAAAMFGVRDCGRQAIALLC